MAAITKAVTKIEQSIAFIGLMGVGKSCIGRRLAQLHGVPFADADGEVEKAAGCSIVEIFERYGEAEFRNVERRVIERLLSGPAMVLATGGGAFMDPRTRATIRADAISLWLRAPLDLMVKRTGRRNTRPLLNRGNPRQILQDLMIERYPVYAEADLVVDSVDGPPEVTVQRVLDALATRSSEVAMPVQAR